MLILKGIIIGIGKIIPGVSGSMLAISMGIYQKLINSINSFFKSPKQNFKFILKIGIGVLISIIFFSKIITIALNKYYLITIFFFIGLIIGSLNDIKSNVDKTNNYITIICFILITLLGVFNINNQVNIDNSIINFIFYIFVGFIDALTMVIPGISGTATLMMIGAYDEVILTFSRILDFNYFTQNIKILIPFIIGMIIGVIITVKIVEYLFRKYKNKTYSAILGFTLSTIVIMGLKCINTYYTITSLFIAFIALFLGIFITKKINRNTSND